MPTSTPTPSPADDNAEKRRESFRRWYAKHRFIYNAHRRARIATDPEYREKENERRRKYAHPKTKPLEKIPDPDRTPETPPPENPVAQE